MNRIKESIKGNVVAVCAHPDDLEGPAGTLFLLRKHYNIHVIYFTHGELGLGMEGLKDGTTARIRTREEKIACKKLGATLHFLDEIDGFAYASRESCEKIAALFRRLKPRAVFLHWPLDVHKDHIMSSAAGMKAIGLAGINPEIYYFSEPNQSKNFIPSHYVDITSVQDLKVDLQQTYVCQCPEELIPEKSAENAEFGRRMNPSVPYAEAFAAFCPSCPAGPNIFMDLSVR